MFKKNIKKINKNIKKIDVLYAKRIYANLKKKI